MSEPTPEYYKKIFNGVLLDPYRVLKVYGITDPAHQHAVKKLLRAGESVKDLKQDVQEVIDTLTRMLQMIDEESDADDIVKAYEQSKGDLYTRLGYSQNLLKPQKL